MITIKKNICIGLFSIIMSIGLSSCSSIISDQTLSIGTFNIAWLGDGIDDTIQRDESDYKRIADIIQESGAEILCLQEIENSTSLDKLITFIPQYKYIIGKGGRSQNVAVLYKQSVSIDKSYEYLPIAVDPNRNRPGLVFNAKKGNFDCTIMVVHFKSSSRFDSTEALKIQARQMRYKQSEIASLWVDSLLQHTKEKDLFIIGDFNDFPKRVKDPTLTPLVQNPSLVFLSENLKSCKFPNLFGIDHIVTTKTSVQRFKKDSEFIINTRSMYADKIADKISDHCPILMQFDIQQQDND